MTVKFVLLMYNKPKKQINQSKNTHISVTNYRHYFILVPIICYICDMKLRKECNLLEMSVG